MKHQALIEEALTSLGFVGSNFVDGEVGIAFTVNGKRLHISHSLLKLSRTIVSVKRAIQHQLGENVG